LLEQLKIFVNVLRAKKMHNDYIINALKEYLQIRLLDFIYNNKKYNEKLIFTGGTCLRFCFNLPRLSEDLDFDFEDSLNIINLKDEIVDYFKKSLKMPQVSASIKGKNKKIYLKFQILKGLDLSFGGSKILFLKVETSKTPHATKKIELSLINKDGLYFYIRRYSLPDLMSGKISAFLNRSFFKGKDNEIDFKGRDAFDLIWYMGQNIIPNYEKLGILLKASKYKNLNPQELLIEIGKKLKSLKIQHLKSDLFQFIENPKLLDQFLTNYLIIFDQYYLAQKTEERK